MKIFDKVLENNRDDGFNHFYIPVNISYANINSFLTLLASTSDSTPTLDQSLTSVSNATSL